MDSKNLTQEESRELQTEWHKTLRQYKCKVNRAVEEEELSQVWKEFINNKNLGVICILAEENSKDDKYIITDEKAWMISKIKYGI